MRRLALTLLSLSLCGCTALGIRTTSTKADGSSSEKRVNFTSISGEGVAAIGDSLWDKATQLIPYAAGALGLGGLASYGAGSKLASRRHDRQRAREDAIWDEASARAAGPRA